MPEWTNEYFSFVWRSQLRCCRRFRSRAHSRVPFNASSFATCVDSYLARTPYVRNRDTDETNPFTRVRLTVEVSQNGAL